MLEELDMSPSQCFCTLSRKSSNNDVRPNEPAKYFVLPVAANTNHASEHDIFTNVTFVVLRQSSMSLELALIHAPR